MISKIRNKWFHINLVLRHRWEEGGMENFEKFQMRNTFNLGIWVKTYEAVGKKKGSIKEVFSKDNHVRAYMIGLNLIVCKVWIDISRPTFGS
jgi:hypothetical protein